MDTQGDIITCLYYNYVLIEIGFHLNIITVTKITPGKLT
jgi:hypothetical protein